MSPQTEAVCFDLDDTLYAYQWYARAGLAAAADWLESHTGGEYHDELFEIHFNEEHTEGSFDLLLKRNDLPETLVDDLIEAYHGVTDPLQPYPETGAVLERLAGQYALGLITDGRGGHEKLRRLGVRDRFDAVLVTPTINSSKHDPAVFRRVLRELSVAPDAAAYVGDDPRIDFAVPNELGMTTIRLRRGRYRTLEPPSEVDVPDHEIEHLDDVPNIVAAMPPPESPLRNRETDV